MRGNPPENYTGREGEEPQIWDPSQVRKSAGDSNRHYTCGHWHRGGVAGPEPPIECNVYGLLAAGAYRGIWGALVKNNRLTSVGIWYSGDVYDSDELSGLVSYEGNLLTIQGDRRTFNDRYTLVGADITPGSVDRSEKIGLLPFIRSYDPFLPYDTYDRGDSTLHPCLTRNPVNNEIYYTDTAGVVVKTIGMETRVSRGYFGTVITGTDGHLYVCRLTSLLWNSATRPITGEYWAGWYFRIEDDINDGPLGVWGVTTPVYAIDCLSTHHVIVGNNLYVAPYQISAWNGIRRMHKDTFEIFARSIIVGIRSFRADWNGVYGVRSVASTIVYKFNVTTLVAEASQALFEGSNLVGYDCEIVGNKLIVVSHNGLTAKEWVHKLNLETLVVEGSCEVTSPLIASLNFQRILKISERYIVIGANSSMTLFDCDTMSVVNIIAAPYGSGYLHTAMAMRD